MRALTGADDTSLVPGLLSIPPNSDPRFAVAQPLIKWRITVRYWLKVTSSQKGMVSEYESPLLPCH